MTVPSVTACTVKIAEMPLCAVAVMTVVPFLSAVITPLSLTLANVESELFQVSVGFVAFFG